MEERAEGGMPEKGESSKRRRELKARRRKLKEEAERAGRAERSESAKSMGRPETERKRVPRVKKVEGAE